MPLEYPLLSNPISVDVQKLNEFLEALTKLDPIDVDGISAGAKRMYEASGGKWQWQLYNGTSWAPVPFLQHNVDQLDGFHAAITPAANTVAVRNASGLLEDSITGNAATASSAATLSQTLPVNKGGTGATTSEAARANLGVPPTSHASTATTYGVGNSTQYGHLKLSDATDSASNVSGGVAATPVAVKAAKDAADAAMIKASTAATSSTPGIVKASTMAAAGVVPLGGADGTLDKGWFGTLPDDFNALANVAEVVNSSGNNWIRYKSGIQFCWGSDTANEYSGRIITLPAPYINKGFSVLTTTVSSDASAVSLKIALYAQIDSETNFTIWTSSNGSPAPGVAFMYMTIGRWK